MAGSTRHIKIEVVTTGEAKLTQISSKMDILGKSVKDAEKSLAGIGGGFSRLQGILGGFAAGFGIQSITQAMDSYQLLGDRLKILTGSTEEAKVAMDGLVQGAALSMSTVSDLGVVYARLAATTKDLGLSTGALVALTTELQQTFRLSGVTAAEAYSASLQLSQGLALGTLRGQDLKAVLSSNIIIGNLLSKQLGITRGELYKFAESGKITSDVVIKALAGGFKEIMEQASKLRPTFEQTIIVAVDQLRQKLGTLNEEFNLSGKFAVGVRWLLNNLPLLGGVVAFLAATQIPALITAIANLGRTLILFATTNPLGLVLASLIGLFTYLEFGGKKAELQMYSMFLKLNIWGTEAMKYLSFIFTDFFNQLQLGFERIVEDLRKVKDFLTSGFDYLPSWLQAITGGSTQSAGKTPLSVLKNDTSEYTNQLVLLNSELETTNKELSGIKTVDIGQAYFEKMDKDLQASLPNVDKFTKMMKELHPDKEKIDKTLFTEINNAFASGFITLEQYRDLLDSINVDKLNKDFAEGKITLDQYNEGLSKIEGKIGPGGTLYVGIEGYLRASGTLAQNIAGLVTSTFNRLEDVLVDFTKTGQLNFRKMTQAILEDLNRILIRAAIIRPLAQGILGAITPSGGGTATGGTESNLSAPTSGSYAQSTAAHGNVYSPSGVHAFASGGVVSNPTFFGFGRGSLGLMGEKSHEAILPLKRGANGDLGVQASQQPVVVNVVNNSGVEAETRETRGSDGSRIIDVIIGNKVKDVFASGGMDKIMAVQYGLARRGS